MNWKRVGTTLEKMLIFIQIKYRIIKKIGEN